MTPRHIAPSADDADRNQSELAIPDFGTLLNAYRRENHILQKDMASQLGITQPYLSKIETGERRVTRLELMFRLCEILDIQSPSISLPTGVNSSDAEFTYDEALKALGRGDDSSAEILLAQLAIHSDESDQPADALLNLTDGLAARATFHLAAIRRDRFDLDGPDGALILYRDCEKAFKRDGAHSYLRELSIMVGACYEMKNRSQRAKRRYEQVLAKSGDDPGRRARAQNRIGVLETKSDALPSAENSIKAAYRTILDTDLERTFGFICEKYAIVKIRQGECDTAREWLAKSLTTIGPADHLRRVQALVVEADASIAERQFDDGERLLSRARRIANARGFAHQLRAIDLMARSLG